MWHKEYKACIDCGSSEKKHMAKGLCNLCYLKRYREDPKNVEAIRKQKADWRKANIEHCLEKSRIERERKNFDSMRYAMLVRYRFRCAKCKATEKLVVHHKDGSGRGSKVHNNDPENLVCLCRGCHAEEHSSELTKAKREALEKRIGGRWSIKHDQCVSCNTTEIKHNGHGYCMSCYPRYKRRRMT